MPPTGDDEPMILFAPKHLSKCRIILPHLGVIPTKKPGTRPGSLTF
jgi:hypothetical protein